MLPSAEHKTSSAERKPELGNSFGLAVKEPPVFEQSWWKPRLFLCSSVTSTSGSLQDREHSSMKKLKELTAVCIPSIQIYLMRRTCQRKSDVIHYRWGEETTVPTITQQNSFSWAEGRALQLELLSLLFCWALANCWHSLLHSPITATRTHPTLF